MSEKQAIRRGRERHCVRNWDLPGHQCLCPRCQRRSARHISTGPATDGPVLHLEILARFRKEAQAVARAQAREARAIARAQARAGAKPKPKPEPSTLSNTLSLTHPAPAGNENNSSTTAERSSVARRTARALARKPTAEWPRGCVPPPATPLLNKCCALEFGWGVHYQCPNEGLHHHQGQLRVCETHFLSPEEGEANKVKDLAAQAKIRGLLRKEGMRGIHDSRLLKKSQLVAFVKAKNLPYPRKQGTARSPLGMLMPQNEEHYFAYIDLTSGARDDSDTLEEAAAAAAKIMVDGDGEDIIRKWRKLLLAAQAETREFLRGMEMQDIHDSKLLKKSQLMAFLEAKKLAYPRLRGKLRPQNKEHYLAYIHLTSVARDDGETLEEAAAAAAKIMVDGKVNEQNIRTWRARKSRTPHGTTSTWGYDWRHFPASAPLQCPQHCRVRCYGDYMAANELTKPQVEAEAKRLLLARFPPVYLPSPCCQFPVRILCLLVGCGYMAAAWLFVAGCVLLTC